MPTSSFSSQTHLPLRANGDWFQREERKGAWENSVALREWDTEKQRSKYCIVWQEKSPSLWPRIRFLFSHSVIFVKLHDLWKLPFLHLLSGNNHTYLQGFFFGGGGWKWGNVLIVSLPVPDSYLPASPDLANKNIGFPNVLYFLWQSYSYRLSTPCGTRIK